MTDEIKDLLKNCKADCERADDRAQNAISSLDAFETEYADLLRERTRLELDAVNAVRFRDKLYDDVEFQLFKRIKARNAEIQKFITAQWGCDIKVLIELFSVMHKAELFGFMRIGDTFNGIEVCSNDDFNVRCIEGIDRINYVIDTKNAQLVLYTEKDTKKLIDIDFIDLRY